MFVYRISSVNYYYIHYSSIARGYYCDCKYNITLRNIVVLYYIIIIVTYYRFATIIVLCLNCMVVISKDYSPLVEILL